MKNLRNLFIGAAAGPSLVLLAAAAVHAQTTERVSVRPLDESGRSRVVASYSRLPLSFEHNQGQTDPRVKFLTRGDGYTLFLTPTEAVLALRKPDKNPPGPGAGLPLEGDAPIDRANMVPGKVEVTVLRMKLLGANPEPLIEGRDELPGKSNYFIGNDPKKWRTGVSQYMKVRYAEAYPGIDLVFYGNQRRLEYDFVVKPGADPGAVQLSFEGADRLRVDDAGNLVIAVPGGEIVQHVPLVYQEIGDARRSVPGRYVLEGEGRVGFQVAAYDADRPLVIDPVLSYSTYLGGNNYEHGFGIAVDSVGDAYVTGATTSTNFPILDAYQGSKGVGYDVFVTKLDPTADGAASLLYSTYLGGNGQETGSGIAVDSVGDAYVTGYTTSTDFPIWNAYQGSKGADSDAFVTKLDPTAAGAASLLYSTYLGGNDHDYGTDIAMDSVGDAYVMGYTTSTDFPILDAYQGSKGFDVDVFVTKLDPTASGAASLLYSTYLGGNHAEYGTGIVVDSFGDAYVTGQTASTDFPIWNAYQGSKGANEDAFVTKLDPTAAGAASLLYSTYLGGNDYDFGSGIAVDSVGDAYVTGYTTSTDFPILNAYQGSKGANSDAFVTKLDPTTAGAAGLLYSTYLGGSSHDWSSSIAVDSVGNAFVTGHTGSTDFPILDAYQASNGGGWDAFVTNLNPTAAGTASLLYSIYLRGSSHDYGTDIAVDSVGNAYVTGQTASTNFPIWHAYQGIKGAGWDAFVTKLRPLATVVIDEDVDGNLDSGPDDVVLITNGATVSGNVDADGATVVVDGGSTIEGNLDATNGATITIRAGSNVAGDVNVAGGNVTVEGSTVDGNLEGTDGATVVVTYSIINGSVITTECESVTVADNEIGGNLESTDDGAVTVDGNSVTGDIEIENPGSCSGSDCP
jgi:hypothetical protein